MSSIRVNWYMIVLVFFGFIMYSAGRIDEREAQIKKQLPTKEQTELASKMCVENICKSIWEKPNEQD